MKKQYYQIAGKTLQATGDRLCLTLAAMQSMETFRVEQPCGEVYEFVETEQEAPHFEKIIYRLKDLDTTFLFGVTADGYRLQQMMDDGQQTDLWTRHGSRQMMFKGDHEYRMVRYALWTGYGIQGLHEGRLMLHSSCIVCHGQAVMFLGESGTGKSTHTRLWREHIPGSSLLNDDGPVVSVEADGSVWVSGSPWSGKTPCYRPERYPLKACVRLSQAPKNDISRLTVLQAYAALHPSCPPAFAYDRQLYDLQSHILSEVLSAVPCYHLACLPDGDAARLSCQTVLDAGL